MSARGRIACFSEQALGPLPVSFVDRDGLVGRERLGWTVRDLPGLVAQAREQLGAPNARRDAGARARAYAQRRHAPAIAMDVLAGIVDRVIARVRQHRGR
jgi:hypothetical protein